MFVGHLGAALALKRADRRINLGTLLFAALLLDLLLWTFVMLGIESVVVPPGFSSRHYLAFVFPFSHGLAASLVWSMAAGLLAWAVLGRAFARRGRASAIVAAAVFSHFVLDALVHPPELPVLGGDSPMIGFGLWNHMRLAIEVELLIAAAGVWIGLRGSGLPPRRAAGLAAGVAVAAALTVAGGTVGPPPPSAVAAALPGVISILAITGIGVWADSGAAKADR